MPLFANALKRLALFVLACVMAVSGVYFAWMSTVVFFLLTGRLSEGSGLRDDMVTPGYGEAFTSLGVCAAVIGICLLLRRRVRRGMAPQGGI